MAGRPFSSWADVRVGQLKAKIGRCPRFDLLQSRWFPNMRRIPPESQNSNIPNDTFRFTQTSNQQLPAKATFGDQADTPLADDPKTPILRSARSRCIVTDALPKKTFARSYRVEVENMEMPRITPSLVAGLIGLIGMLETSGATCYGQRIERRAPVASDDATAFVAKRSIPDWRDDRIAELDARLAAIEASHGRLQCLTSKIDHLPTIVDPPCCRWYAGYDSVIVKPYFSRNVAYWDQAAPITEVTSFDWDMKYTPRVYLGFEGTDGFGFEIRYWNFHHSTSTSATEGAAQDFFIEATLVDAEPEFDFIDDVFANHSIRMDVLDFDLTKRIDFCSSWVRGSAGIRYARLDQQGRWTDSFFVPAALQIDYGFEGAGPTLFLEYGHSLFGGNLSAFVNSRGSLLFGQRSGVVLEDFFVVGDVVPYYDMMMPVVESQLGLDWKTSCLGVDLSMKVALEAQTWFRGGAASGGDDEGLPADQIDLGLFGLSFATVLYY